MDYNLKNCEIDKPKYTVCNNRYEIYLNLFSYR